MYKMCYTLPLPKLGALNCPQTHIHCLPSNPYLKFFAMRIKTHENLIYTAARWLLSWLMFSYWWEQTGFIPIWCFLALPLSMCFLPMLMAELPSRLWGALSKDCPFVAYLHCGDQGVQRSAKLYRGLDFMAHKTWIWHFLLSLCLKHSAGRSQ